MIVRKSVESLTLAQKRRIKKVQGRIATALPELIHRNQLAHNAMNENSLSGVLRRAIHTSRILLPDLARRADVDMSEIGDFLVGERPLASDAIDRLTKILKLKLQTSNGKPKR